jgi:hypothetical protein
MNKQQLTYVRIIALVMSCVVASLTIFNLFTIATKSITVDIPTEEDISWSIDPTNKEILFRTAFAVSNQGTYDISDIDVSAQLMKDDVSSLISFEKQDMVVLRGSDKTFDVLISLDLDTISWFDWFSLMYQNTTLKLDLDIDASYMFGLVDFTVDEVIEFPWTPPIANLSESNLVEEGMKSVLSLLDITQKGAAPSYSDIISLISLPQISYIAENGFAFHLNISNHSETMKNITCRIVTPFLIIDGGFEFTASILVGIDQGEPVLTIEEVGVQYVK